MKKIIIFIVMSIIFLGTTHTNAQNIYISLTLGQKAIEETRYKELKEIYTKSEETSTCIVFDLYTEADTNARYIPKYNQEYYIFLVYFKKNGSVCIDRNFSDGISIETSPYRFTPEFWVKFIKAFEQKLKL
jgi:hypothetical protein